MSAPLENIDDLVKREPGVLGVIQKFVKDPYFDDIKDLFVENVPGGESGQEKDAVLCHGKYLGIRYLFKELKRVAKQKPPSSDKKKDERSTANDPDLSTEG